MLPLVTHQQRHLLKQSQLANQKMADTVDTMLAELQTPRLSRRSRRQRLQALTASLNHISQDLAQQRQQQQQICDLIAPQSCTATALSIVGGIESRTLRILTIQDSATAAADQTATSAVEDIRLKPPRIIGHGDG